MAKLRLEVVTAEREVLAADDIDMVVAPGGEGELGILPRHAPLLSTLQPGVLRLRKDDEETLMAVSGGFIQVYKDRVLVLADTAERADEIEEARAEEARTRAAAALQQAARGDAMQAEAARMALRRSLVRLNLVRRRQRRGMP